MSVKFFAKPNGSAPIRKRSRAWAWDSVAKHKVLGKRLGGFEPGSALIGTPDSETGGLKSIDDTQSQQVVRADNGKVRPHVAGESEETIDVVRSDRNILDGRSI
jgi:hypothetical protein